MDENKRRELEKTHRIVELRELKNENDPIVAAAACEAMMSYMKRREGRPNADTILVDRSVAKTDEDLFHFARVYRDVELGLLAGTIELWPQVEEIFKQMGLPK